ncbi:hypothetical protein GCM10007160_28750 [Litchfieldella qijiaojingensis]|uniref:Lipoprotein n=1 Tax=Litchfieldella qijiaojingensis TaxID=980347 RepID=A0ABQ2YZX0_9GAMM|nr:hypothetical protein [Halomonas qijiaojingensis]GGX99356.1 hypothetical protein GCM10007160_28750 [Halomonas qijiaojingensis]
MLARVLLCVVVMALSACATTPTPVEPRTMTLAADQAEVLETAVAMLVERGYVIRHADPDLGRVEAVSAAWPGYEVTLQVDAAEGDNSRISFSGRRGRQPLAPYSLDPLLVDLQARLGLAP